MPPIQYAGPQTPVSPRWRPATLMIASGIYGVMLIAICAKATRFKQIFSDFKVEIPMVTQMVLWASHIIWDDYVWIFLLPLSILWPLIVVQFLPLPQTPQARRRIALAAHTTVVIIYLITIATVVFALFAPMIMLMQSVAGPTK